MTRPHPTPWTREEENRLLIYSLAGKPLSQFAPGRRTYLAVRLKLMRLHANPATRPPACATPSRVAEPPQVPASCGTSDRPVASTPRGQRP